MLFWVGLAGCVGPRYVSGPPAVATPVPSSVTTRSILQPSVDASVELARLPRSSSAPIALRRAFLELELGHPRAAIDATSQVLYGTSRPSANQEAFARYLRALAYVRRGTGSLADYDINRASALAMDPGLKLLLAKMAKVEVVKPRGRKAVAALGIRSRGTWRAATANRRRLDTMDRATRITVHHSAMYFRNQRPSATAGQLRRIQNEHMRGRGYGDIGYHYLIDPAGRIWQGREMRWQGAHASGQNNVRNVGICVLGNFVHGAKGHRPTNGQITSLRQLLSALMYDHRIAATAIHRHSDFKATECPGPLLEPIVNQLARELGRRAGTRVANPDP